MRPVEYKIIAVGDDITVRNEKPDAIAADIPNTILSVSYTHLTLPTKRIV